jgi:hypothetical protein
MNISLQSISLPYRAKQLISEYSKPVTHPEWQKSKPIMSTYRLFKLALICDIRFVNPNLFSVLMNNIKETEWFQIYRHIVLYGIGPTCMYFKITSENILKIEGMTLAKLCNDYNMDQGV